MPSVRLKDMTDSFQKAILIDIEKREIWVIKENRIKVYNKKFYEEFIANIELGRIFNMMEEKP